MKTKILFIVLLGLNLIVLLGQLWPEGAPPFARIVNIITLVCNIVFIAVIFTKVLRSNYEKK